MANVIWKVKVLQRGKSKDVSITLGPKSEKVDVFNALRRRGIGGEIIGIKKQ